jgi:hypothetical protein
VIDDSRFGLIPLTITGYNAGTNVISLATRSGWSLFYGQGTNLKTGSNLETRIQAATTLGVGERLTTFTGVSINQSGTIHLENASGYHPFSRYVGRLRRRLAGLLVREHPRQL